ncbi:RtcB family protein [Rhodococcus daqingensis]|uniref:3'-phosphate/5'-hydroxy nucleic acid ligase n=1 Tax=Rhodococcus daqingensis TaxID=2479363 RepID=A0ABW2S4S7_9NOCA
MPPVTEDRRLLNFASQIEGGALAQARQTASMPFIHPHVALMPDAHLGKGSAVGTVIPTLGVVIPAAVGVDIGCGMIGVRTEFTEDDVDARIAATGVGLGALRLEIERAIPLSPGHYNADLDSWPFTAAKIAELEKRARREHVDLAHSPKWRQQLGSLGGGNHFIELCLDETDRVWLFLHSGSRGVGNKIAQHHIQVAQRLCGQRHIKLPNRDLAYLTEGTPEFDQYIRELNWAQRFAYLNRAEMMDRFGAVFARWMGAEDHRETERVNCHHNYTQRERHGGKDVWLTRKGAVDAHAGVRAMIPGSMGTHSYVVEGKGNAEGLCSAPHGAGRRFSRTEAKRRFTQADLRARMRGIEYRDSAEFVDEIPDAYKEISTVMADARDLVTVLHELRQIVNVKGT